jgi:hypothetical protein
LQRLVSAMLNGALEDGAADDEELAKEQETAEAKAA